MAKKSANSWRLKPFQVRWTQDDIDAGLPERFAAAVKVCSGERAAIVRGLIREWVRQVEAAGCDPALKKAAGSVVEEQPPAYGKKNGGKKTK